MWLKKLYCKIFKHKYYLLSFGWEGEVRLGCKICHEIFYQGYSDDMDPSLMDSLHAIKSRYAINRVDYDRRKTNDI